MIEVGFDAHSLMDDCSAPKVPRWRAWNVKDVQTEILPLPDRRWSGGILSPPELDAFRNRMRQELMELSQGLVSGVILRQHPVDMPDVVDRLQSALQTVLNAQDFLAPALVRR